MAPGIFSVTLEDFKQQADEFGVEAKGRTKFLKEEWRKLQDANLEKERFDMKEKRLEREMEEKQLESEREMEEKCLESDALLQSEKLAAQLELERLQLETASLERENVEARTEVQLAASSQAGRENITAVTKTLRLPGLWMKRITWITIYCDLRDKLPLRVGNEIRGLFGLTHCLLVKH